MDVNSVVKENSKLNLTEIKAGKTNLQSKPIQFNIDLTGRCNINPPCVFCSQKADGYHYNAIDISAVDKYLPFLSRCETVTDCSFGEPLTHPDFLKLVQKVAENGQAFTFATNGLLLN
jgi:MoaA/NifB/PqqE/SkfB family radical SAM enzyme